MTSLLGFKAREGSLIRAWWRHTCYTFPEIHLWCDTYQPFGSQHADEPSLPHTYEALLGFKTGNYHAAAHSWRSGRLDALPTKLSRLTYHFWDFDEAVRHRQLFNLTQAPPVCSCVVVNRLVRDEGPWLLIPSCTMEAVQVWSIFALVCSVALCDTSILKEYMLDFSVCSSVPIQDATLYSCDVRCKRQSENG